MSAGATGNLNLSRVHVLLVDDNEFAREFVTAALNSLNLREILKAENGRQALELIESHLPDLVLVDWMMEPVNGLELIRALRTHESRSLRFMPIIMISAYLPPQPPAIGSMIRAARSRSRPTRLFTSASISMPFARSIAGS